MVMTKLWKNFWSDKSAAVAFEMVIIFPILLWAWIGTFAFFDAYRVYNTSIKATYTVADLLSRQLCVVYDSDLDGMAAMLEAMIRDTDGVEMRATEIIANNDGTYRVMWSYGTGSLADYATPNLSPLEDQLPNMAEHERVVLVESFVDYDPAFDVGLNDLVFENFTLTRPRYADRVVYNAGTNPDPGNCDYGRGST